MRKNKKKIKTRALIELVIGKKIWKYEKLQMYMPCLQSIAAVNIFAIFFGIIMIVRNSHPEDCPKNCLKTNFTDLLICVSQMSVFAALSSFNNCVGIEATGRSFANVTLPIKQFYY